ncbi:hypothetical protein C7974DRAFT_436371 [Boeremia exigua]|uniref:uncharacterized protein n=1 Tax=Boeremia exigua TaxID=749465 RepID=UPI001E8D545D|nr:uncharacterized protein C7974DRAFT_436371 [Boeremia exigua]KAH6616293.1 hypothetical protein C7974DRAFT_436371 [Boeremia exigua]
MQFKYLIGLLATTTLALAIPLTAPLAPRQDLCPVVQTGDYVWKISNFWARKLNGTTINSLTFNVQATNGGTADFDCESEGDVEDGVFYSCGPGSFIYWAYQEDRAGLLLRQDVGEGVQYVAATTLPNFCRAGGAGPMDYVCQGVAPAFITLVQYPGGLE